VRGGWNHLRVGLEIRNGTLVETQGDRGPIQLYVAPDDAERRTLVTEHGIDAYDLESALDPDEISRVEFAGQRVAIIWNRPKNAAPGAVRFEVSSLGLFLEPHQLIIVLADGPHPFEAKEFRDLKNATDVVLRLLLHTVRHYLAHLKIIRQVSQDLERKISASMENKYLLQMFTLSESLVYYQNAIEANGAVLAKLKMGVERAAFPAPDADLLDDLTHENRQCARQAQIYGQVLSGLMDARGTIVNNNMNVMLKNLTLINVIFLPLNLIASVLGMSEFTMMTQGLDWRLAYTLFGAGMVALGLVTWKLLVRAVEPDGARSARS
jgi:magnesium transporter